MSGDCRSRVRTPGRPAAATQAESSREIVEYHAIPYAAPPVGAAAVPGSPQPQAGLDRDSATRPVPGPAPMQSLGQSFQRGHSG